MNINTFQDIGKLIKTPEDMRVIDEIKETPMGDDDIRTYLPNAKIIKYTDLKNYNSIDQILPNEKDYAIILYQNKPSEGHWCCCLKYLYKDVPICEFFDPYGIYPDDQLDFVSDKQNVGLGIKDKYLTNLLEDADNRNVYNKTKFQSDKKNDIVNTCGRHCVNRILCLLNKNMNLDQYTDYMKKMKKDMKLPYDDIVSALIQKT